MVVRGKKKSRQSMKSCYVPEPPTSHQLASIKYRETILIPSKVLCCCYTEYTGQYRHHRHGRSAAERFLQ